MKWVLTAIALTLGLAAPALAQDKPPPSLFSEFLSLCDATNVGADAAIAKARAAGYVRPPEQFIKPDTIPGMREVRSVWKVYDGGAIVLLVGVVPFDALPGVSADACAVFSAPPTPGELDKVEPWAGVPAAGASYVYLQGNGQHQALTSLADIQAGLASGDLRATATRSEAAMTMLMLIKPKV